MNTADQNLIHSILQEVDTLLKQGVLPLDNYYLKHLCEENILEHLLSMKHQGLISGDLISIGIDSNPYKLTNIRLTYAGMRALR